MTLELWITQNTKGFTDAARKLGIDGVNPGATLARLARGERWPDAEMIERIATFTNGQVGVADMHEARLRWLASNSDAALGAAAQVQP